MKKKESKFELKQRKLAEKKVRDSILKDLVNRFNALHILYPYPMNFTTKYAKIDVEDILKLVKYNQDLF